MSVATASAGVLQERYRLPIFWPSQLKLYLDCPERYHHKYISRSRVVEPFSRDLARGIALHAALARSFGEFQWSGAFPSHVRELVDFQLRQVDYPTDMTEHRDEDAEDLTTQIQWTLVELGRFSDVLGVEQTLGYYHHATSDCPTCLFRAKLDLVLAHADGSLEHIDFKGGKVKADPIQEVLSRIVVAAEYGDRFPEIRTTTIFVAKQQRVSAILDRAACRETWTSIKRAVAEIQSGTTWKPSPSPFCGTCPYFSNGCSLALENSRTHALNAWLDGDA